jgi:hypothetical protein
MCAVGAGNTEGGLDFANMLKPALARSALQVIGATTLDEYRQHIETDPALNRRFQVGLVGGVEAIEVSSSSHASPPSTYAGEHTTGRSFIHPYRWGRMNSWLAGWPVGWLVVTSEAAARQLPMHNSAALGLIGLGGCNSA